jgi:hypothetical protein
VLLKVYFVQQMHTDIKSGRANRGRDRIIVGFTTTCAINVYQH